MVDQAGQPWKKEQKSDNLIGHGDVLARNEWSTYKTIVSRILHITLIVEISFTIVIISLISTAINFGHDVIGEALLGGFFIFLIIINQIISIYITLWIWAPPYRFTVYENGFTYDYKLPGTDFSSNYMPYSYIRSIYFKKYGTRMILVLNTNRRVLINIVDDYKAYVTLMMKLKTIFHFNTFPDIPAIINYKEAQNQEASQESFHNEELCHRYLIMKNFQFV